jgi:hypothetical protein
LTALAFPDELGVSLTSLAFPDGTGTSIYNIYTVFKLIAK